MLGDAESQNKTIDYRALGLETEQPEFAEIKKQRLNALNSSTIRLMQIADKIADRVQGGKQFSKFRVNNEGVVDMHSNKRRAKKRLKDGWTREDLNFIDDGELEAVAEQRKIEIHEDKLDGFFMMSGSLAELRAARHSLFYLGDFAEASKKRKNRSANKKKKKAKKKGDATRRKEKKRAKPPAKDRPVDEDAATRRKPKKGASPKQTVTRAPQKRVDNVFQREDLAPGSAKIESESGEPGRAKAKIREDEAGAFERGGNQVVREGKVRTENAETEMVQVQSGNGELELEREGNGPLSGTWNKANIENGGIVVEEQKRQEMMQKQMNGLNLNIDESTELQPARHK